MYSHDELIRLDGHKAALRRRIAGRREQFAAAFAGVTRPLVWLDRVQALWRRISPLATLAALPLALVAKRVLFPRAKLLGTFLRWGPMMLGVARSFSR
ncbi:MAG: hypothetical protein CFE26_27575, partial [Verrucomicrobiales bacterium VVV1]